MGKIIGAYLVPHPPIILSEIGKGKEKEIHNTIDAMNEIAKHIKNKKPDTIVLISPHGPVFRDAIAIGGVEHFEGDMSKFGTYEVSFKKENDIELAKNIDSVGWENGIPTILLDDDKIKEFNLAFKLDHGAIVPLYFIEKEYSKYKLIHITYGLLSREELYKFGKLIQKIIKNSDKNAIIIASGDLSHKLSKDAPYGYSKKGKEFDELLLSCISNNNVQGIFEIDDDLAIQAGECGFRSIQIMFGALDGYNIDAKVNSYDGPFGVGYAVASIEIGDKNNKRELMNKIINIRKNRLLKIRKNENQYVRLARLSLETYINKKQQISMPNKINNELTEKKAGVFVSIKKEGDLRGCIGTTEPITDCIGEEIIKNSISAGTKDPRFYSVEKSELEELEYSVDVLQKPTLVNSIDELDVKKYGVIVESNNKKGLLLPNLIGIDNVTDQINIALKKAGIGRYEDYKIYKFEVTRHK